ncbi:MAG TPA: CDP-glucose 4,6-dehydratase, partial [Myxococcota bacterium]
MSFGDFYRGRRVLLTGDTGFKGAWLARWLELLGADVVGLALPADTTPALTHVLGLRERLPCFDVDIRDERAVVDVFASAQPELVMHLAAQPLVRASYRAPVDTFATNVMGTAHVLEAIRTTSSVRAALVVTTDKVYENRQWPWPYREHDALGGHDPYSASKAAAEIVVASYRRSFFADGPRVVVARAGNVIGGGDWAAERLVPDIVRAIGAEVAVELRHPDAVRPWQHVLDANAGYLHLLWRVATSTLAEHAFNFGPDDDVPLTVGVLAQRFVDVFGRGRVVERRDASAPHEAHLLRLDSSLARSVLGWRPAWSTATTLTRTAEWYRCHL